jgi:hypothetical protein
LTEIITLFVQLIFLVFGVFIGVPLLWYILVNNLSLTEISSRIKLKVKGLDMALLWGVISVMVGFSLILVIALSLKFLGFNLKDSGNISELELYFSVPSMLVLLTIQPIGEEIFFRGFLLDKISNLTGEKTAIFSTALLFGMAHLSYGKAYSAAMTGLLGIIFAVLVVRTRNLTSAIFAHILFNITSFTLFLVGKSLNMETLIL